MWGVSCLWGSLRSSASVQSVFCSSCSTWRCISDVFVGSKVISTSYSSTFLKVTPFTGGNGGWWTDGSFRATEDSAATGVQRAKRRDSRTEDRCRTALTSPRGLSAHPPGRAGLGAEAPASEIRPQGEDWGWLREHRLKGASAPQLDGRESGKNSGPA